MPINQTTLEESYLASGEIGAEPSQRITRNLSQNDPSTASFRTTNVHWFFNLLWKRDSTKPFDFPIIPQKDYHINPNGHLMMIFFQNKPPLPFVSVCLSVCLCLSVSLCLCDKNLPVSPTLIWMTDTWFKFWLNQVLYCQSDQKTTYGERSADSNRRRRQCIIT